jgi:8-oxo-dGTP pyrophosphatase MutT (NUDIX family)
LSICMASMYHLMDMEEKLRQVFATRPKKAIQDDSKRESAVLIPVFCKDNEYHIIFTKRSFELENHRGQISFPGGGYSEEDQSLEDTALRESQEEIGLNPKDVEILGELDDIVTSSNFIIRPYVGMIPYPYEFTKNPNEILEIFDVPVLALFKKLNYKVERRVGRHGEVSSYFYKYKGKLIWGATATILKQLLDTMKVACKASS